MIWFVVSVPVILFLAFRTCLPSRNWDFDWDVAHATFTLLLRRYTAQAQTIAYLSTAILWASYGFHVWNKFAAINLNGAGVYAVLFMNWLSWSYESYLHLRYPRGGQMGPSNYSTTRLSVTYALGLSSLLMFVVGALAAVRGML